MDELGFSPAIEYVTPEWRAALITQINALNFWMLARGPAAVRAFGATKAGVTMVTSRMLGAFRENGETRREFLSMISNLTHGETAFY